MPLSILFHGNEKQEKRHHKPFCWASEEERGLVSNRQSETKGRSPLHQDLFKKVGGASGGGKAAIKRAGRTLRTG